jgi:tRNA pseudouridine55 synthase
MHPGVIFLDKPLHWTSRKAVNEVVRLLTPAGAKRIKAGHTGTLDPLATGMLPILVGEATRFSAFGLNAEKVYEVTLDLSYQTDTLDCEGDVAGQFDGAVDAMRLNEVLRQFMGPQQQVPPAYSAIRIDGKRAHEMARKGEEVQLAARDIEIIDMQLLEFAAPLVSLRVHCSKGTYIRSLARDIGAALGMGGCVVALRRISTGGWPADMMITPEALAERGWGCVLPLAQWLRELPVVRVSREEGRRFIQGQRLQLDTEAGEGLSAVYGGDMLLGTGEVKPGQFRMVVHPARILPSAQEALR